MFIKFNSLNVRHFHIQQYLRTAKKAVKSKNKYSATVKLLKTDFPQWFSVSKRLELDDYILKNCGFSELYSWQRNFLDGPEFVLHDGPPYANGMPHMGHAINKVLKDIINRSKIVNGQKVHYVPGWDCHGLPIELKAIKGEQNITPLQIRTKAKSFAEQTINDQKYIFRSWGVMADWESNYYKTCDQNYICNQLWKFYELYKKGLIYRDFKPVYWSPSSMTALAEAELEYEPNHESTAATVRLQLQNLPEQLKNNENIYALIWTSTPWTLPANQAIAYNPHLEYSLVKIKDLDGLYILATDLLQNLEQKINATVEPVLKFSGSCLSTATYLHPVDFNECPFWEGSHVNCDIGTGLVHTAPAHGPDDFNLALVNKKEILNIVDENGNYTEKAGQFEGISVLNKGSKAVLKKIRENVIHTEKFIHPYPYDWRTKKPVIIRASKQWFIDTETVKAACLAAINEIEIIPERLKSGLASQMERRPFWCISRQRSWGVPIPVLYSSEEPIINESLINHYCNLVKEIGPDFWWTAPIEKLVPDNIKIENLTKGQDIMDIWLDSGLSWSSVLDGRIADLYLEGLDQFTGWFQSSLITSVGLQQKAPFKKILVHGFAVDGQGRKMSKSIGNVIDPNEITRGTVKGMKNTFGVDVLRWWVAAHATDNTNIPVSATSLSDSSDSIKKIRNILKFILGILYDFPKDFSDPKLSPIDIHTLNSLVTYQDKIDKLYDNFQFNKVCSAILYFVTNDLSSNYCHITKDSLYCDEENSDRRRAIQYTMLKSLDVLTKSLAPILPLLAEEIYLHHPHNTDKNTFFCQTHNKLEKIPFENLETAMEKVLELKEKVLIEIPVNVNCTHLECIIEAGEPTYNLLKIFQSEEYSMDSNLVQALQMASVTLRLKPDEENFKICVSLSKNMLCERCRRLVSLAEGELCLRCVNACR